MGLTGVIAIGLLGAIIMFFGDMLLYFDKNDYEGDGTFNPIIEIMKKESRKRLYLGGMIGPLAASLYCVGYYHIVLMANSGVKWLGWICFLINSVGIICGGAYHSHWTNIGLIGKHNAKESMQEVLDFMDVQKKVAFGLQAIGFLLLAIMIFAGLTVLPRWVGIFTPGILFLLTPAMRKLPKGLHIVIYGGWTNIVSVIYYTVVLIIWHAKY